MKNQKRQLVLLFLGLFAILPGLLFCNPNSEKLKKADKNNSDERIVLTVKISGPITPSTLDSLEKAIDQAEDRRAAALLVQLNTPGGLMTSMDSMCQRILNANVPVITYVYPLSAHAGSAGVYIMYASHLAAMSDPSNIGSATPVTMGGGKAPKNGKGNDRIPRTAGTDDAKNMKRKIINHAIAQIRSYAEFHGRNADFAEQTITHAANIPSRKALKIGAIDLIANSPVELLEKAHGRKIQMKGGPQELNLSGARLVELEKDFRSEFLGFLTNPVVVNLLMMIGMLGILAEIQYPGSIFPGAAGAICLILGLYGMQSLSVDYTGIGLIILGFVFFLLEIKIISYGLLSIAGVICFLIGSILLAKSGQELMWDTLIWIVATTGVISGIMALLIYKAVETMQRNPVSGVEYLLTETGISRGEINSTGGKVDIHSEIWNAVSHISGQVIGSGVQVSVVERDGLTLRVVPTDEFREPTENDGPPMG